MGPLAEEKVCRESNGLSGIVVLKLFPEKRAGNATRGMIYVVFCGSS